MGQRHLIDSNVIIDYTANSLSSKGSDFVEQLFDSDFLISVVVKIEVLGFADFPAKLKAMEEFVNAASVLPLDETIAIQAIQLRRKHKKLKLGDAIIAATALVYNLTLITRNISDFKNISELKTINPHKL